MPKLETFLDPMERSPAFHPWWSTATTVRPWWSPLMNRHTSTLADAVVGVDPTGRPEREVQFVPLQAHGRCTKYVRAFWKQMLAGGAPRALPDRPQRAVPSKHRNRPAHEEEAL